MYALALKNFLGSRATHIGLAFILLTGVVSLFIGKRFLAQQNETIALTTHHQQQHIEKHVQFFNSEMGSLLYYLRFSLVNPPDQLAGISIGQRDVNPSIHSVTIRNLESQKYDTDLNNPFNLLLGNLDFGFVIIYLFPLLIMAFTYNVLSEEKEGGTWNMIRLHARSPLQVLWQKIGLRMAVVYAAAALLLIVAVEILSLPLNTSLMAVVLLFFLYLLFWFTLSFWVVSWQKSSSFNAVCLLALWVVLTILSPALVNSYISHAYPVAEALETAVKQRQGYHEKWDMDKQHTMNKFYAHYPQFKQYPLPDKQFSWLWYFAMQQMGDDDARQESKKFNEKLWKREEVSTRIALALPVLHTQHALNNLAGTGLQNHLQFMETTNAFHEKMRLFFYPKIFEESPVSSVNWKNMQVQYFSSRPDIRWVSMLLPLILLSSVLFWLGQNQFRRSQGKEA